MWVGIWPAVSLRLVPIYLFFISLFVHEEQCTFMSWRRIFCGSHKNLSASPLSPLESEDDWSDALAPTKLTCLNDNPFLSHLELNWLPWTPTFGKCWQAFVVNTSLVTGQALWDFLKCSSVTLISRKVSVFEMPCCTLLTKAKKKWPGIVFNKCILPCRLLCLTFEIISSFGKILHSWSRFGQLLKIK